MLSTKKNPFGKMTANFDTTNFFCLLNAFVYSLIDLNLHENSLHHSVYQIKILLYFLQTSMTQQHKCLHIVGIHMYYIQQP